MAEKMILIGNGQVVTRGGEKPFYADGAVLIEGKLIKEVGTTADLKAKYSQALASGDCDYIDAKSRLVMPGFINAHEHYYSTFARGMDAHSRPATTVGEILTGLWWKLDKLLTLDDVYYSCVGPMLDELRCGVTSVIDHHASPHAVPGSLFKIAEAAGLFGIRHNLCYETSDRDGMKIRDEGVKENEDFAKDCAAKKDDMLRSLIGMHASFTISDDTMDKCLAAAARSGVGFHIHAAEGIEDVVDCIAKYDMRVINRLHKRGILCDKSIAVHCINITGDEIDLLKESGVATVHNPESNMGNAAGVAPIMEMLRRGVLVGMGTDGYTHDMTESYKFTGPLQKHTLRCPSIAWAEPPAMLFENNPAIMNRFIDGRVGTLAPGYYADLIIVDYKAPTPVNENTINSHILFGITGRHVDTTIINGKIRMKDRCLVDLDEEALLAKSRERAAKLWERI